MTRIVAGQAGGRRLRVPARGTRPATELVREAVFNALEAAGELDDARVLDLYAGSGALGLEALSRGAREAVFIESDRRAAEVVRGNIAAVGLGGTVCLGKVHTVLAEGTRGAGGTRGTEDGEGAAAAFDIVLADPPFALENTELTLVLETLAARGWVAEGALVIIERHRSDPAPTFPESFTLLPHKRYGDAALHRAEYVG